jgi:hypothetical protein
MSLRRRLPSDEVDAVLAGSLEWLDNLFLHRMW